MKEIKGFVNRDQKGWRERDDIKQPTTSFQSHAAAAFSTHSFLRFCRWIKKPYKSCTIPEGGSAERRSIIEQSLWLTEEYHDVCMMIFPELFFYHGHAEFTASKQKRNFPEESLRAKNMQLYNKTSALYIFFEQICCIAATCAAVCIAAAVRVNLEFDGKIWESEAEREEDDQRTGAPKLFLKFKRVVYYVAPSACMDGWKRTTYLDGTNERTTARTC